MSHAPKYAALHRGKKPGMMNHGPTNTFLMTVEVLPSDRARSPVDALYHPSG